MKITETIERQCCQPRDLKPIYGSPTVGRRAEYVFCVHCGRYHMSERVTDAAGSTDDEYRPLPSIWEMMSKV